ncbi:hypothetical protein [Halomonas nitroreducens]|uniref:DUF892 family protein n=1 Tax=Halomonas nitroreducens TaxID=447425 RepID=A0A431V491_9GAMM|nr:hypothetical protein [Halomonas nitroreducens]RTR05058.1 hypothetical protein EKG36_08040 [Halomonas nitroreducens]
MSHPHSPALPAALLPDELLALASDQERQEMGHYRRLAFGFLPFGRGISRLMATLGIECERRLGDIHRQARDLAAGASASESSAGPDRAGRAGSGKTICLITGRGQALAVLKHAEAWAEYAVRVAMHLQEVNATPCLQPLLLGLLAQKQAERHILAELVTAYDGQEAEDARLASRDWPRGWLAGARRLPGQPSG